MAYSPLTNTANGGIFSGLITSDLHVQFRGLIDALLEDGACTTPCILVYKNHQFTDCECTISGVSTRTLANPSNFCSVCNGAGKVSVEEEFCLSMAVTFDSKHFSVLRGGVYAENQFAETMCRVEFYPHIKGCDYAILDTCNSCYSNTRYERYSEPQRCGLGKQEYIITAWRVK